MNIENIKTKDNFFKFADIWYQRTIALAEIWQNNNETERRRLKALILWRVMFERMGKITQIAIQISKPKPLKNIKSQGSAIVGEQKEDRKGEIILTPNNKEIILPPRGFRGV